MIFVTMFIWPRSTDSPKVVPDEGAHVHSLNGGRSNGSFKSRGSTDRLGGPVRLGRNGRHPQALSPRGSDHGPGLVRYTAERDTERDPRATGRSLPADLRGRYLADAP